MSKRVICLVDRGPMEKTAVIAWEHEIPILNEIHGGGGVVVVDTSQLTDGKEALLIKGTSQLIPGESQNFKVSKNAKGVEEVEIVTLIKGEPVVITKEVQRVPLVPMLEKQLGIGERFSGNADEEYSRLENLYGGHATEKMTNVRALYGRFAEGRFEQALRGRPVRAEAREAVEA